MSGLSHKRTFPTSPKGRKPTFADPPKTLTPAPLYVLVLFVSNAAPDRNSGILRELAELGLSVARDLQARVAAAEDDATANQLARSFERVSRSVRHCLALEARLLDGFRRRLVEDREQVAEGRRAEISQHRHRVREAMEHFAFTDPEVGDTEVDYILERAGAWLEREVEAPDFLDLPVEQHIARLRRALGRDGAAEEEEAEGDPVPETGPSLSDLPWRSSA